MSLFHKLNIQRGKGIYLVNKQNSGFRGILSELDQVNLELTMFTRKGVYDGTLVMPLDMVSYFYYGDPEIEKQALEYICSVSSDREVES